MCQFDYLHIIRQFKEKMLFTDDKKWSILKNNLKESR